VNRISITDEDYRRFYNDYLKTYRQKLIDYDSDAPEFWCALYGKFNFNIDDVDYVFRDSEDKSDFEKALWGIKSSYFKFALEAPVPPPARPEEPLIPTNWKSWQSLTDIAYDLCITADAVNYHLKKGGLWSNNIRQNATGTWYTSPGFRKNCKIQEKKTVKREKVRTTKKGE
jgi:hypothetical protein